MRARTVPVSQLVGPALFVFGALAILTPLAVLGFVSFLQVQLETRTVDATYVPSLPAFVRPMMPNCGEVFYCINSTDPNPSYVAFLTQGPSAAPFLPTFINDPTVFNVSDPFGTTVLVTGTYSLVVFAPLIVLSNTSFEVAIILTRDPGQLLATPAISGDLSTTNPSGLTLYPTHAGQATAIVHLDAGETVRVGYVVSIDNVVLTPGAYIGGALLSRD